MASSSSMSSQSGSINLQEVRHEQRRVAALLRASGQIEVPFPPYNPIPLADLFKGKFYRQVQAARSLPNGRVPPLGHQLLSRHRNTEGSDPDVHADIEQMDTMIAARLAQGNGGLDNGELVSYRRRHQAAGSRRTLSTSLPASNQQHSIEFSTSLHQQRKHSNSDGHLDASLRSCHRKSFSNVETLMEINQKGRFAHREKAPRVDYRLPRTRRQLGSTSDIVPELRTPPHLHYNIGDGEPPGNFNPTEDLSFSPTVKSGENTTLDEKTHEDDRRSRRKKKRHRHSHKESDSESSETSSSCLSRERASTSTSRSDDNPTSQSAIDIDGRLSNSEDGNDNSRPDFNCSSDEGSASRLSIHGSPSEADPKPTTPRVRKRDPADDPYGRAYVQALSVARSKEIRQDPLYMSQRITRPFTFSYFCQKKFCQCGNCPPKKRKKKAKEDGKTGFKAIFGDVNIYDYLK